MHGLLVVLGWLPSVIDCERLVLLQLPMASLRARRLTVRGDGTKRAGVKQGVTGTGVREEMAPVVAI